MRTSPKQAWPHGANPCLGITGSDSVSRNRHVPEVIFLSRNHLPFEEWSAVPKRLASLKAETGGTGMPAILFAQP